MFKNKCCLYFVSFYSKYHKQILLFIFNIFFVVVVEMWIFFPLIINVINLHLYAWLRNQNDEFSIEYKNENEILMIININCF